MLLQPVAFFISSNKDLHFFLKESSNNFVSNSMLQEQGQNCNASSQFFEEVVRSFNLQQVKNYV